MKLKQKTDKSLESFVLFPYIAWVVTVIFAVFVYNIAQDLQQTANQLRIQADILELNSQTPVEQITDFSR